MSFFKTTACDFHAFLKIDRVKREKAGVFYEIGSNIVHAFDDFCHKKLILLFFGYF